MSSEFISIISKKLRRFGLYIYPIRCSKKEIQELEIYAQYPLPETYKEFLAFAGRGVGKDLEDINIFYPRVFENRNSMNELLEDESDFKLSETDFVFSSYQGEQFMYFNLREGDDPPVYFYDDPPVYFYKEEAKVSHKEYDNFTECILEIFRDTFG